MAAAAVSDKTHPQQMGGKLGPVGDEMNSMS